MPTKMQMICIVVVKMNVRYHDDTGSHCMQQQLHKFIRVQKMAQDEGFCGA